jgi:hypothetical protein
MGTLRDFLKHESAFARRQLARLGDREHDIDLVLSVAHLTTRFSSPLMEGGGANLGAARLLVDVAVFVEQAILCTLRAQPRLGWASLRVAAEATKNLECIRLEPEVCNKWIAIGFAKTRQEADQAQRVFANAKKAVAHTVITRMCQEVMWLSSMLGSHANAAALGSMGPMPAKPDELSIAVPVRVTDEETLDWHLDQLVRHAARITDATAAIRMISLDETEKVELERWRYQLRRLTG